MNTLKITLNGDEAARFLKIKKRLNYDSNAKIIKTLIVQYVRHVRKSKHEKPDEEHISKYDDGCNLIEEGLEVRARGYFSQKREKKAKEVKETGTPLQIKIRLTERETKTLDTLVSAGEFRSRYEIVKNLAQTFINYYSDKRVNIDAITFIKIRKKWPKSEKSEK